MSRLLHGPRSPAIGGRAFARSSLMRARIGVAVCFLVLSWATAACDSGNAPAGWADRHGLAGGGPAPNQPLTDPRDDAPSTAIKRGQARFWVVLTVALIALGGLAVAIFVPMLESRQRTRRSGDDVQQAIVLRLGREPRFADAAVAPTPEVRFWRNEVRLVVSGAVASEADGRRALEVVREEAARAPVRIHIVDRLAVRAQRRAG